VKGLKSPTMKEVEMELEGMLVIEEHLRGSDNLCSEETENFIKAAPFIINVVDGIGGSGINSSDSGIIYQISMSLIGGTLVLYLLQLLKYLAQKLNTPTPD
jgi:hypothetical protein